MGDGMVTVLGHRGYLGAVVERRWRELGTTGDYVVCCLAPDDLPLLSRLSRAPGLVVPSTDAIAENTPYAATKRLVECLPSTVIIRAGIVDIRKRHPVAWRDWYSNPLTPLEWADLAWERRDSPGVHIAGREAHSRADIARLVAQTFGGDPPRAARSGVPVDRVQQPDGDRVPLAEALADYRDWLG